MKYFIKNAEVDLEEAYLIWMENYQSIPFDISPRYHKTIPFEGFCDYMTSRFNWRIK